MLDLNNYQCYIILIHFIKIIVIRFEAEIAIREQSVMLKLVSVSNSQTQVHKSHIFYSFCVSGYPIQTKSLTG